MFEAWLIEKVFLVALLEAFIKICYFFDWPVQECLSLFLIDFQSVSVSLSARLWSCCRIHFFVFSYMICVFEMLVLLLEFYIMEDAPIRKLAHYIKFE